MSDLPVLRAPQGLVVLVAVPGLAAGQDLMMAAQEVVATRPELADFVTYARASLTEPGLAELAGVVADRVDTWGERIDRAIVACMVVGTEPVLGALRATPWPQDLGMSLDAAIEDAVTVGMLPVADTEALTTVEHQTLVASLVGIAEHVRRRAEVNPASLHQPAELTATLRSLGERLPSAPAPSEEAEAQPSKRRRPRLRRRRPADDTEGAPAPPLPSVPVVVATQPPPPPPTQPVWVAALPSAAYDHGASEARAAIRHLDRLMGAVTSTSFLVGCLDADSDGALVDLRPAGSLGRRRPHGTAGDDVARIFRRLADAVAATTVEVPENGYLAPPMVVLVASSAPWPDAVTTDAFDALVAVASVEVVCLGESALLLSPAFRDKVELLGGGAADIDQLVRRRSRLAKRPKPVAKDADDSAAAVVEAAEAVVDAVAEGHEPVA